MRLLLGRRSRFLAGVVFGASVVRDLGDGVTSELVVRELTEEEVDVIFVIGLWLSVLYLRRGFKGTSCGSSDSNAGEESKDSVF